jgi:hypothetical protein
VCQWNPLQSPGMQIFVCIFLCASSPLCCRYNWKGVL